MHARHRQHRLQAPPAGLFCLAAWVCFGTGCHQMHEYRVVTDARVTFPGPETREMRRRAGAPADVLTVASGGHQTVLIACHAHDDPKVTNDEWSRAFVIALDEPPEPGTTYEVTPANGRLIEDRPFHPARIPYTGIEGEVTIVRVRHDGDLIVDCRVRSVLAYAGERPRVLRGRHRFRVVHGEETRCAVRVIGSPVVHDGEDE